MCVYIYANLFIALFYEDRSMCSNMCMCASMEIKTITKTNQNYDPGRKSKTDLGQLRQEGHDV